VKQGKTALAWIRKGFATSLPTDVRSAGTMHLNTGVAGLPEPESGSSAPPTVEKKP
jgi:hypothetical protein